MRKIIPMALLGLLCACGGGGGGNVNPPGGGNTLPPAPQVAPVDTSLLVSAEENFVNGDRSWYTSGAASWSTNAGDAPGAPNGSAPVDGSSCTNVHEGTQYPSGAFSQHVFVGIFYNGVEQALPQAIGMVDPQPPTTPAPPDYPNGHPYLTDPVELSQCRYNVHSHDYSGLVHIEDTSLAQSNTTMPAYATLQTLFDAWGAQLSANGIIAGSSSLKGRAVIYVGTPSAKNGSNDVVNSYALYTGAAGGLQFSKHMAVWIAIGSLPAAGFPEVQIVQSN